MLLGPVLHYLLQYLLLLVLSFDTLGFIVNHNKTKDQGPASVNDYSRLVFSWVYVLTLKSLNCWLCCVPLIDELVLGGIIYVTLPLLQGTQKLNSMVLGGEGVQALIDLVINRIVPPKKKN